MMTGRGDPWYEPRPRFAPVIATLAAGPIFGVLLSLANVVTGVGTNEIARGPVFWLVLLPWFVAIGVIVGILPIALGTLTMGALGRTSIVARTPWAWMAVGAGMGIVLAIVFDARWHFGAPLVVTSVLCARIARIGRAWD